MTTATRSVDLLELQTRFLRLYGWTEEQLDNLPAETLIYNKHGKPSEWVYPTNPRMMGTVAKNGGWIFKPSCGPDVDLSIRRFLAACCTLRPDVEYKALHLWYCYTAWTAKEHIKHVDRYEFTSGIASLEGVSRKRTHSARLWKGIRVFQVPEGALDRPKVVAVEAKGLSRARVARRAEYSDVRPSLHDKKQLSYDMLDLSGLPAGQFRAIVALIGDGEGVGQTYPQAAKMAGMAEGTLLTHINRVRQNHPELYGQIRDVRLAQLAVRHHEALEEARAHSRRYFRRKARWEHYGRTGHWPTKFVPTIGYFSYLDRKGRR